MTKRQQITRVDFPVAGLSFSPVIDITARKVCMTGTRLIQPTLDTFLPNCITEATSVTRRDIRAMDRSFRRLRERKAFISSTLPMAAPGICIQEQSDYD